MRTVHMATNLSEFWLVPVDLIFFCKFDLDNEVLAWSTNPIQDKGSKLVKKYRRRQLDVKLCSIPNTVLKLQWNQQESKDNLCWNYFSFFEHRVVLKRCKKYPHL